MQYENLMLRQLELQLKQDINDSGLSVGSIYWLLKSFTSELESLYHSTVQNEQTQYLQDQEQKSDQNQDEIVEQPLNWDVVVKDTSEEKQASGQE